MTEKKETFEYYLGVDYGQAKAGLAIGDSETRIAFAFGTLRNDKDFYHNLMEIIRKEKISKVIIGIPSRVNREKTEYAGEKLGEYLKNSEKIPVEYQDEMYSTKIARENLKEKGLRDINRFDDEESARIILDSWFLVDSRLAEK